MFEEKGFLETRVADIVQHAAVAQGTFYSYFDSKDAIFREVARQTIGDMLVALRTRTLATDPYDRVRAALRRFIDAYRPNAAIIGLIEQVGTFTPEMRDLRLSLRDDFVTRTERGIHRLQADGVTDPALDPRLTAEVLGAMADHTCYVWLTLGKSFDEDKLLETLTFVWASTLGIKAEQPAP